MYELRERKGERNRYRVSVLNRLCERERKSECVCEKAM